MQVMYYIYGDQHADESVVPPLRHWDNTVKTWKWAVSHFMPNCNIPWDEVTCHGNPTTCSLKACLIKNMKHMQTQCRGIESQARTPMNPQEFEYLIQAIWDANDVVMSLCAAAFCPPQFSMIGRVDDTSKFHEADLKPYTLDPNYIVTARLCWSKNVTDERDAPDQILFGAMDPKYDVLSALGLWSEYHCQTNPEPNEFIFGCCGLDDPVRIKEQMSRVLKHILSEMNLNGRRLGTHSLRKLAVTFARGAACSKVSQFIHHILFVLILTTRVISF